VEELEKLEPAVPSLALAFHHATYGMYMVGVSDEVLAWADDHSSGAAAMARNALELVKNQGADPNTIKMFRPSMVAITNAMNRVAIGEHVDDVLQSLEVGTTRAVDYAVQEIQVMLQEKSKENPVVIATFSRSSTLAAILQRLQHGYNSDSMRVVCSKSTPGDEGILMAQDLGGVECVDDEELLKRIRGNEIDLVLAGSDCVTEMSVVNKIGTARLAEAAAASTRCKVYCCTDRWKQWDDICPPPLEDIFESIPKDLFDKVLMPPIVQECEASNL